jgi:selenide,water dikinase
VLSKLPQYGGLEDLLVGNSTCDDAAVLRIDHDRAIVQTVDFFTPIVDDPELFGAIAATNSISDIYAMGAEPILGLAIAGFPSDRLPLSVLEAILRGGAKKASEAGFPVAGGHTIIDDVPKYGLAVTGIVDVARVVRNSSARPGDQLYLTKPIGNGIMVCAHRGHVGKLKRLVFRAAPSLDQAVEWMLLLNRDAARAMVEVGVSAATDVTGYGLVGHLLEVCCASAVGARIRVSAVPVLDEAREWLDRGCVPAGTERNLEAFRSQVQSEIPESELTLMCDAQTSGGLLIAVAPERSSLLESAFNARGVFYRKIGELTPPEEGIRLQS